MVLRPRARDANTNDNNGNARFSTRGPITLSYFNANGHTAVASLFPVCRLNVLYTRIQVYKSRHFVIVQRIKMFRARLRSLTSPVVFHLRASFLRFTLSINIKKKNENPSLYTYTAVPYINIRKYIRVKKMSN